MLLPGVVSLNTCVTSDHLMIKQAGNREVWCGADPDVRECLAEVVDVHFRFDRQVFLRITRTSTTAHCMHSLRNHSMSVPCTCPRCMGL